MARRLYLHIGTMKSGTTYIQGLFDANKEHLLQHGLLWPEAEIRYRAVRELLGRRGQGPAWNAIARQIGDHDGAAVFSNELLAVLDPADIARLVAAFPADEIRVVVTARSLVRVIPSHWQSKIKDGWTKPWSDFAVAVCSDHEDPEHATLAVAAGPEGRANEAPAETVHGWFWRRHDVPAVIARWGAVVPLEQLTLVTVPVAGGLQDVLAQRFGSVLGVTLTGLVQPESSNPSLGAHSAELLRRLNADIAASKDEASRSVGPKMALAAGLIERAREEPRYALTAAQHEWVAKRANRMAQEIEESGVTVVGELSDLTDVGEPVTGAVDPAASSDSELLQAASYGLVAMIRKQAEARDNNRELEDEVRRAQGQLARAQRRLTGRRRELRDLRKAATDQSQPARGRRFLSRFLRGIARRNGRP